MKKTILICLVLAIAIGVMSSCDVSPRQNNTPTEDLEFHLLDDGTYGVSAGNAVNFENIVIPSTHEDKPVTKIMDKAFYEAKNIKSIIVPDSVTSIGDYAFAECSNLKELTIGNGVTFVGDGAFNNCSSLKKNKYDNAYYIGNSTNPYVVLICGQVSTPDNPITSCTINEDTRIIGYAAFALNSDLKNITITDSVTCISGSAFYHCENLANITISDSVTSIGIFAFNGCNSLISINIGNGVTNICEEAFYDCQKLETVEIPRGIMSIGNSAFSKCPNLTRIIFNGTESEWNAVSKGSVWISPTNNYTVTCKGN